MRTRKKNMKKIAIEEDFDGNLSSKTKTTKEMKRFGEIPPRLYFMPDVEVKNLQNTPLIPYKNLNLAVVNPDVNGEYLITKLLPKDDKPFYYNVRTARDINEKNHLADFVFAKNNGNPFVNPKLYKFDLFFKDGVEDGIFYTTGINDMYEEVYRIMTNFDFYINTIFFKICDYAKMFSYIEEYLTNSNIVLNDFQLGIVKYNLTSKGFPYIVSLYIKMENFKRNKCTLDEAIKMDEFGYDDDLLENFRELIMKSTTVSCYGFKDSDPAEKAAYSEGQKHSNMFKKIFENEQPTFIFNYTEKKSVNALKAMYGSILLRVPKSVELDFILYVFVARNDICYDLSLITEVLKSAFLLTENNNVNYFDYLIDNDTPAITDKEQRLKYNDLFKKYAKGVKGFNSDLWQIKKVYEDAIYIYDYTLSNSDNRFVVVNRDSIKNIVYISNDVFIEPYQLNDGDYDGMQQETVIEKDENGQEVVLEQKTGIRLNKFNDGLEILDIPSTMMNTIEKRAKERLRKKNKSNPSNQQAQAQVNVQPIQIPHPMVLNAFQQQMFHPLFNQAPNVFPINQILVNGIQQNNGFNLNQLAEAHRNANRPDQLSDRKLNDN